MIRVVTTVCHDCPFDGDVDVAIDGERTYWQCPECMTLWAGRLNDLDEGIR